MARAAPDRAPGRVVVGMSGGVDSSVVAALLKDSGFDVIGVTMQIWHRSSALQDETVSAGCCTVDAVDDARRVARLLDIPYYVPNFRAPFSAVVDDFVHEYTAGRTPNPCVRCNQFVRFDGLLAKAREVEADYVATGHYARVGYDRDGGEYTLMKAADRYKDQSYVLHTLKQEHLARLLLPLGGLTKDETRVLARRLGLPVANKPDSQEICFVAGDDYRAFLQRSAGIEDRPGPIVDTGGTVVGEHKGVHRYTVGQRKGLGIGGGLPRYVVELRPVDNAVVVGTRDECASRVLDCNDVQFTGARPEDDVFRTQVMVRYRAVERPATVAVMPHGHATVTFDEPVRGAAPGQLAVFYDGERVVGGATITGAHRS